MSAHTGQILRQLRLLTAVFAGCFALGLVGFWTVTGLMHTTLLLAFSVQPGDLIGYQPGETPPVGWHRVGEQPGVA